MELTNTQEQAAVAAPARTAENLFVTVPETALPDGSVEPAFQVGQFLCSQDAAGNAVVTMDGTPWVDISYHEARKACADAGFELLTERQALSIAIQVAHQGANWTGGIVGEGSLYQGLHLDLDDVDQPYDGHFVSADKSERRTFVLANGEYIHDAAGNAYTWIFDNVQGDEHGVVARAFAEDALSINCAPRPSMKQGMGWFPGAGANWSGDALIRGGCWCSGSDAGVFHLSVDSPGIATVSVGFRCTKPIGL